ncbi:MAG: NAD(P)-binding domain-containing protein [Gammaproteobacteria bacterium]|nr:NAD(P)-binding domain-containing protein [Gammaproteobacteria bacterium]
MTQTLGFVGVGDLAEYTISGLRRGGYRGRILLSPRNHEMSKKLAQDWQCKVMESNQAVADSADQLILSTRPGQCLEALGELSLRTNQLIISVVAGVSIASLQEVAGNNCSIVRAMPVNCARACASPTLIYPEHEVVCNLFNYCGDSIAADDESAFDQGNIIACVYTWYFELFQQLIDATSGDSLSTGMASKLVLGMAKGAASLALDEQATPGEIAEIIATEGTFSKLGLDILKQASAFEPWQQACDKLSKQMRS